MEKIPVYIITPKKIDKECNLWYIPYCPVDIKDTEKWYQQIDGFIKQHIHEYNILHIPNSIYEYKNDSYVPCEKTNNIFIVGLRDLASELPSDYHSAYCLTRGFSLSEERNRYLEDALYNYGIRMFVYCVAIIIIIMCIFLQN